MSTVKTTTTPTTTTIEPVAFSPDLGDIFLSTLQEKGFFYIEEIPQDFAFVDFLRQFGELYLQYDNKEVWDVKPNPQNPHSPTSVGDMAIQLHTEFYERTGVPPSHVAFYCRRPAEEGGELSLVDAYRVVSELPAEMLETLTTLPVRFASPQAMDEMIHREVAISPVITTHASGRQIVKYHTRFLHQAEHPHIDDFVARIEALLTSQAFVVRQKRQSMLVFDNFRLLHGRSSFSGLDRLLHRICMRYF